MIIFITGTDTGVGKTVVSGVLAQGCVPLLEQVAYLKVVQTGPQFEDSAVVTAVTNNVTVLPPLYHYPDPVSPDQAYVAACQSSAAAVAQVEMNELIAKIHQAAAAYKILICEGAGGVLVPLNLNGDTWQDVLRHLGCPYVLVSRSTLGTLNHTALSLNALSSLPNQGFVVMSGDDHPDNQVSLQQIASHYQVTWVGHLPQLDLHNHATAKVYGSQLAAKLLQHLSPTPPADHSASGVVSRITHSHSYSHPSSAIVWHPYTQHGLGVAPLDVIRAQGNTWTLSDGRQLLDGISSWWTSILGHGVPELAETLKSQQQLLDHVLFGGVTHQPARDLAAQVVAGCNQIHQGGDSPLDDRHQFASVFFSDNGSTAVEVALKMAYVYSRRKRGLRQGRFVALRGGYHGDTLGAMSVSKTAGFHDAFAEHLVNTTFITPHYTHKVQDSGDNTDNLPGLSHMDELDHMINQHGAMIYGVIIEPCIQGAAGMRVLDHAWLSRLIKLCTQAGIPLIFDEVFVGLYRLGTYLATHQLLDAAQLLAGDTPQIVCLAKGLTGGTVPLAVTVTKPCVYEAFYSSDPKEAFQHGHTYTANPIACQVALKTHELLAQWSKLNPGAVQHMEQIYHQLISSVNSRFLAQQIWHEPRACGSVFAFELGAPLAPPPATECARLTTILINHGLFVRPLGATFYLCPALNTPISQLQHMGQLIIAGLTEWHETRH